MERVLDVARQELMLSALERRANANGRAVALELKAIATGLPSPPDSERLAAKLAERRKMLASRAFPEAAGQS